ncbi:hypothetical protein GCM10008967_09960 [Bacillus carboniphilus]|uniref:Uncharacterized protein n=1 Tax=Bacillus carboniphilus TaxID=86663 RepID=A0ABN0W076_9BACI
MPRRDSFVGEEASIHPDGEKESIINDSMGQEVGVTFTKKSGFDQEKNPFHLSGKTNEKMKEFEKMMDGDSTKG